MLALNNLRSPKGATRKNKRIAVGKVLAGELRQEKCHKGQKARSGGGIPLGFGGWANAGLQKISREDFQMFL